MIPEPQRTYVLELMTSLGPAAEGFVLAGAQAMKFLLPQARATRDFDFVLDVVFIRERPSALAGTMRDLGYVPVEGARRTFELISRAESTLARAPADPS